MAKGPVVSDEIKKTIAEVYHSDPNLIAKEVMAEVNRRHDGKGPGLSSIQKSLSKIRARDKEEAKKGLEVGWSVAVSDKYDIPRDAYEVLLRVWRWNIVVGRTFTVREARWVARLWKIIPYEKLLARAVEYGWRERVAVSIGSETVTTIDLDLAVAFEMNSMDWWPYRTAINMKVIPEDTSFALAATDWENEGGWLNDVFTLLIAQGSASHMMWMKSGVSWRPNTRLPEHGDLVYALWMRRLVKQFPWNDLLPEDRNLLAEKLYEEVATQCEQASEGVMDWPQEGIWVPPVLNRRAASFRPSLQEFLRQLHTTKKTSKR